jgi:hypothetical protein
MINLSLAGLIGAMIGTAVAAVIYHLSIGVLERAMREKPPTAEVREAGLSPSIVRRAVLTVDLVIFAGLGYWLGRMFDA